MPDESILVGGPQDGARIKCVGPLPIWVHVGPKWLGDGFAAWARKPSVRFPAKYEYDGRSKHLFVGYEIKKPLEVEPLEPCQG